MSVPQRDIIAVLTEDHERIEQAFRRLEQPTTAPQRGAAVQGVSQELLRHSAAEKQWLYPELRKLADGGDAMADHELHEHAAVEKALKELENVKDPDAPMFHSYLTALITDVRQHIAEEESEVFPRLRAALPPADLIRLGDEVEKAERKAPTHPHPAAPSKQPGNKILSPIISMMDRVRDKRHHGRHSVKR